MKTDPESSMNQHVITSPLLKRVAANVRMRSDSEKGQRLDHEATRVVEPRKEQVLVTSLGDLAASE